MKRITEKFSQHIAIILCIFILLTSVCSFVFKMDGRNVNTQFFAADFSFFYPSGRQSLSGKADSKAVSWLRSDKPLMDKQSPLVKNDIFSEANTDMPLDCTLQFDNTCQGQEKTRKYYMRI